MSSAWTQSQDENGDPEARSSNENAAGALVLVCELCGACSQDCGLQKTLVAKEHIRVRIHDLGQSSRVVHRVSFIGRWLGLEKLCILCCGAKPVVASISV